MSPDKQPAEPQEATAAPSDAPDQPTIAQPSSTDDTSPEPPNPAEALAEEEEAPPPSSLHQSAAAGTTEDSDEIKEGREQHGKYFIGMWHDLPNFGCPYCAFSIIGTRDAPDSGNGQVELHVLGMIDAGNGPHMAALMLKGE